MSFKHFHKNTAYGKSTVRVNRNPLRKIVGETYIKLSLSTPPMRHEVLECGHVLFPNRDFMGFTYEAKKRRCDYCGEEAKKDKEIA